MHAGRRGRRPAAAVPGFAGQHSGAAVLLEAALQHGHQKRHGIRGAQQPVHGDRRQPDHMPEHVPGRFQWRRTRRKRRADLLLYKRIVRESLWSAGPDSVPNNLNGHDTNIIPHT